MAAVVFRAARGARPPAHPERRQFRARAIPRRSAQERRLGVRVFAVARNPDPQDGRIWPAATSEDHDRDRTGNGNRRGRPRRIHGRAMISEKIVIPGSPEGRGPEPMTTGLSLYFVGSCPWFPGSRAAPAPRNDNLDTVST